MSISPEPVCRNGFTLVEMMVALFIFSLLAVASVSLLRTAVDTNAGTGARLNDMAVMQRFLSLVEADLSQAIARPYRNEAGTRQPAFDGAASAAGDTILTFTRSGVSVLDNQSRSSLQRISYRLRNDGLERLTYDRVDGGIANEPVTLLQGVEQMTIRYRDRRGQWIRGWQAERLADIPRAMEWRFTYQGREYRQVFLVGTGYL